MRIQPLSPEAGLTEPSRSEGQDVLIVGGEDHKTGQAEVPASPYARLESWARLRFPMIREVKFRWSGQVLETIDTPSLRGVNIQRLFGSQRAMKSVEDFTEFEQRAAYFDGDPVIATKKGVNILERGSQVHQPDPGNEVHRAGKAGPRDVYAYAAGTRRTANK